jgi:hypothetical protein
VVGLGVGPRMPLPGMVPAAGGFPGGAPPGAAAAAAAGVPPGPAGLQQLGAGRPGYDAYAGQVN